MPTPRRGNTSAQSQPPDHSLTKIVYDREERSLLAIEQGKFTQQHFINPHKTLLEQWSANFALC